MGALLSTQYSTVSQNALKRAAMSPDQAHNMSGARVRATFNRGR